MSQDKIARFWDKFIDKSRNYGIEENAIRWHVRHAERYIKAHEGLRLTQHQPAQIESYLDEMSRKSNLRDWQYKQIVMSLKILFLFVLDMDWARFFPWQDKMDEATGLSPGHATIARDSGKQPPVTGISSSAMAGQAADSLLSKVSQSYPAHFQRLSTEIRMRQYSIRTEKAYREWLARYIHFNDMQDPELFAPTSIASYLEYLVVKRNVSSSTQSQALNALVFFLQAGTG